MNCIFIYNPVSGRGKIKKKLDYIEKSLKENIIAFSPLAEAGEKLGVYLGIENLMKYPNAFPKP